MGPRVLLHAFNLHITCCVQNNIGEFFNPNRHTAKSNFPSNFLAIRYSQWYYFHIQHAISHNPVLGSFNIQLICYIQADIPKCLDTAVPAFWSHDQTYPFVMQYAQWFETPYYLYY